MEKQTKIQLSFICPTEYISTLGSRSDFILALSHLIDLEGRNKYTQEIIRTRLPILLDNGNFELHTPEPLDSLIAKALKIGATTFFAPDKLFDPIGTQIELEKAINASKTTNLKVGAVVQADNVEDYLKQLVDFQENPDVSLIGLSILSIPKSFEKELGKFDITESRIKLLQIMKSMRSDWKSCHLLGIGDSYKDVLYAKEECPWVVSNDSSCAFQSGLFGREITDELEVVGGKVHHKVDFKFNDLLNHTFLQINSNIIKIKNKIQN